MKSLLAACVLCTLPGAVVQVAAPGGFFGAVLVETFEDGNPSGPGYGFDGTAITSTAAAWAGNVTPSPIHGLVESRGDEPLRLFLAMDHYEVGAWFGNDDFGLVFNATLEIFDAGLNSLGSVSLAANRNDWADQFLGLRSDTAFRYADFRFQRPQAQNLSIYIDDLYLGNVVIPEPSSMVLLSLGLAVVVLTRKLRK